MKSDLKEFLEYIDQDENIKQYLNKYFERIQPRESLKSIKSFLFYEEYVSKFKTLPIKVDEKIAQKYDIELLVQLFAASLHSDLVFEIDPSNTELVDAKIIVDDGRSLVEKYIRELEESQICRLFHNLVKDQMELYMEALDNDEENESIKLKKENILRNWNIEYDETFIEIKRICLEYHISESCDPYHSVSYYVRKKK
jgi:hypothetical protein